jgi:hypothetical protein
VASFNLAAANGGVVKRENITISEMSQNSECFCLRGGGGGRASQVEFGTCVNHLK